MPGARRPEQRPPTRRESFDDWLPTAIRYTGLAFTIVLISTTIVLALTGGIAKAAALSPGYVAAAGLILYKTVHNSAKANNE